MAEITNVNFIHFLDLTHPRPQGPSSGGPHCEGRPSLGLGTKMDLTRNSCEKCNYGRNPICGDSSAVLEPTELQWSVVKLYPQVHV